MANTTNRTTRIKHVFGNVLKLAIPLTLRTVTLEGGIVEVTDTDYTPSNHYPVVVQFVNGPLKYELDATIRDNYIAVVEDKGTIPVGNYAIVVLCKDDNGDPRRFKQRCVLEVVDVTADAGIEVGIEFEAQEWLLDGAIFLAIKGEDGIDGVGIESITTDETSVSGEYNQVTFHLTNGSSYTLNVRNGESTEQTLPANVVVDENYVHTDNNYTDTDKQKIESVDKLFADAEYDRISRRLNFFKHGDTMHTNPLKSIDITDFVRDSRVSSFRIVDGNLTIRLNSDGNNEEFKVPITSIFNPDNYYTRSQINNRFESVRDMLSLFVPVTARNGSFSSTIDFGTIQNAIVEDNREVIVCVNGKTYYNLYDVGDETVRFFNIWYESEDDQFYNLLSVNSDNEWSIEESPFGGGGSGGGYTPPQGGIPKTDLAPAVQTSLNKADTALQSSDLDGYATTDDVDDAVAALVSSAPQTLDTLKELADALGDDPNFATTMATQLGNKVDKETGKGLSTNDYTTAEKNKLAGLENYDDSALQTAIDGKVDKETGKSLMTDAERTKLQGIAAGAEVNVQPNWTQTNTSADDYIKNKPTLATVATSGSYNDLQDKPTIPAAYDDTTLSGRVSALENAGFIATETDPTVPSWAKAESKPTYTAQEVGALPASTTIPTKVSDLTNDSSFVTTSTMNTALAGKQNTLTFDSTPTASSTNPVTSGGVKTYVDGKATITGITTSQDGTFTIAQSDGNSYTVDLNHVHPQYLDVDDIDDYIVAGNNVTITKDSQTGVLEISASGGGSGSQVQANWNESDSTSAAYIQNKPTIPTVPTNVSSFTNDANYLKFQLCADEAAYNAISTKDSGTLYLIPES